MNFMHREMTANTQLPAFLNSETCREDVKKLLEKSERTLEKEGVLDQVIKLSDWIETWSRTDQAGPVTSDGYTCLQNMRERLQRRADDLIRLEGEGGLPATPAQELEIAELSRAVKRIDHMIGILEGRDVF